MSEIDVNRIAFATREYRTTPPIENPVVLANHPLATEFEFQTLLRNESDAITFGQKFLALRQKDRWTWACYVNKAYYPGLEIGQTVTVFYPRYGFDNGADFIIKRIKTDSNALFDELTLFGPRGVSYPTYALALDFCNGSYWKAGSEFPLSGITGYTFTRSGAKQETTKNNGGVSSLYATGIPAVVPSRGLYIRNATKNAVPNSRTLDNETTWGPSSAFSVVANEAFAPDGSQTADRINFLTAGGMGAFSDVNAAGVWTFSVFVKPGTKRYVALAYYGAEHLALFDLVNGAVVPVTPTQPTVPFIIPYADGWYRIGAVLTVDSGHLGSYVSIVSGDLYAGTTFVAGQHIWAWEPQVHQGYFSDGGPIITTPSTTSVAIGTDALKFAAPITTEQDFLLWGVFNFVSKVAATEWFLSLNGGGLGNVITLYHNDINTVGVYVNNGVNSSDTANGSIVSGRYVVMARRKSGKMTLGVAPVGGAVSLSAESAVTTFPTVNNLAIGSNDGAGAGAPQGIVYEKVFLELGTFSDAQMTSKIQAVS